MHFLRQNFKNRVDLSTWRECAFQMLRAVRRQKSGLGPIGSLVNVATIISLIIIVFGSACSTKDTVIGTAPPTAIPTVSILPQVDQLANPDPRSIIYTIGPFDRLKVTVWRYPELSGEKIVKEDGTLFIPETGHINVEGLTLREAQEKINSELKKRVMRDPEVDIEPVEVSSKVFTILGAVANPGRYPIFRKTDIQMALAMAGGRVAGGVVDRTYLSRGGKVHMINIRTLLVRGNARIYLAQNDVLYIPTADDQRVFVLGYVNAPGPVSVAGSGLDLFSAISAAGGFRIGAKRKHVAVLRPGPEGIYAYKVNVKEMLKLKGDGDLTKLALQPGDIVFVPKSKLASWNEVIQMISPTLNALVYQPLGAGRDYYYIRNQVNQ
jgi:polysaccharide biosynthesis/export protein